MSQKENVLKAIGILKDADKQLGVLLKDSPELLMHSNSVLRRLCNGYAHAVGLPIDDELPPAQTEKIPLTHIAGMPIKQRTIVAPTAAVPAPEEEDELKEFVDMAYEDLANPAVNDLPSIHATYNELIIRGVAVKAGMPDITPTNPAVIDIDFIAKLQEFIRAKGAAAVPAPEENPNS